MLYIEYIRLWLTMETTRSMNADRYEYLYNIKYKTWRGMEDW